MISRNNLQLFLIIMFLGLNIVHAQDDLDQIKSADEYLSRLPSEFKLVENEPQKYTVTSTMHNRDMSGKTVNKILMTAEYIRGLEDGFMRWNNVRIGAAQDKAKPNFESKLLECMEDFSYQMSGDIIKEEFYQNFPMMIPGI